MSNDQQKQQTSDNSTVAPEQKQSFVAAHPTFLRSIYSFLIEAVKDTPDGHALQMDYLLAMDVQENFYHEMRSRERTQTINSGDDFSLLKNTDTWMQEIIRLGKEQAAKHTGKHILEKLYTTLDALNTVYGILSPADMRKLGETIQRIPVPGMEAPGMQLWQSIRPIVTQPAPLGTRPILNEQSQTLLETFLTTPKSMSELAKEGNWLRSVAGVRKNLYTSLGRIWEDLPQEARQGYQSPEEAIQAVVTSPIKTKETRRKIQENERPGWKEEKPRHHTQNARKKPGEGKRTREFSDTHQTNLSLAASRRWQRQREISQAESNGNTPT